MENEVNFGNIINQIQENKADFCDLRFEDKFGREIELKDGKVKSLNESRDFGAGVRVLFDGSWGVGYTNNLKNLGKILDKALKIAKNVSNFQRRDLELKKTDRVREKVAESYSVHPRDYSLDFKIDMLKEAENRVLTLSDEIKSTNLFLGENWGKEYYLNSEGTFVKNESVHLRFYSEVVAAREGDLERITEHTATTKGFEWFEKEKPKEIAKKAGLKALKALNSIRPPTGTMPVIIEKSLGGLFAHEAVGHAAEADHVFSDNSIFKGLLNEKIASEEVTLIDDPSLEGKHGTYTVDDEGVRASETVIIDNGVLKSFLHSRETASKMDQVLTGNGRRESFREVPLPRMSNTYFDEGNWSFEEMVEEIDHGIYVKGVKGGEVKPSEGNFTFQTKLAEVIEDGELKETVKGPSLSGLTLDVLKGIDAVGKDLEINDPGYCGKGQTVRVDEGSPHLRVKQMVVG